MGSKRQPVARSQDPYWYTVRQCSRGHQIRVKTFPARPQACKLLPPSYVRTRRWLLARGRPPLLPAEHTHGRLRDKSRSSCSQNNRVTVSCRCVLDDFPLWKAWNRVLLSTIIVDPPGLGLYSFAKQCDGLVQCICFLLVNVGFDPLVWKIGHSLKKCVIRAPHYAPPT